MNIKNHHEHRDSSHSKKALKLAIGATAGILVIEVIGGIWTNSLALLSDAAHVFMDLLSLSTETVAQRGRRGALMLTL